MGMFDEMLARLGESNVSDAEIRQIMEKAAKEAGVCGQRRSAGDAGKGYGGGAG